MIDLHIATDLLKGHFESWSDKRPRNAIMVTVELFEQVHGRRAGALPETPFTQEA